MTTNEKKWTIDRSIIEEEIPDIVSQIMLSEVLKDVGGYDWNCPNNVSKTISAMMSVDLCEDPSTQIVKAKDLIRTVLVGSNKDKKIPFWICQSVIRIDKHSNNLFIEYEGSKYNKVDIIKKSEYFKKQMDKVASAAHCTWNVRWGNPEYGSTRLYQETRPNSISWLERCSAHLLNENDTKINIKDLVMIEFKRDLKENELENEIKNE